MNSSFLTGFEKRAADVAVAPQMLKKNEMGGVEPRDVEAINRAGQVGLITLPVNVEGAACGSCQWFNQAGFCRNEAVMQDVTERMLCTQWTHPGVVPAGQVQDAAQVPQPQPESVGEDQSLDKPGTDEPGDQAPAMESEPGPEPKPVKPEPKKTDKPSTHTINVNVGGGKK